MNALISIQSGLVPLIEGLCAQISNFRFKIIGGLAFTSFAFLFRKQKYVEGKSSQSKISSQLLAYTYTCVLCTHIRIYLCRELVYLDSLGSPGVSSRPLGSQPRTLSGHYKTWGAAAREEQINTTHTSRPRVSGLSQSLDWALFLFDWAYSVWRTFFWLLCHHTAGEPITSGKQFSLFVGSVGEACTCYACNFSSSRALVFHGG